MINRRNFLKQSLHFSTIPLIDLSSNEIKEPNQSKDQKKVDEKKIIQIKFQENSLCPLCSIGCRTILNKLSTNDQITIESIKPDSQSPINNGLLCAKFENFPTMQNETQTRITTPLLKMKNGVFAKDGILTEITWQEAFDIMEKKAKEGLKTTGVDGVGAIISESLSLYEQYALGKLFKAGLRSNNILNLNDEIQRNSFATIQTLGVDGSNGTLDDLIYCDNFISFDIDWNTDYGVLRSKLYDKKFKNQKSRFINIIQDQSYMFLDADSNLLIKPDSQLSLFNFLINQLLQTITKDEFDYEKGSYIFALFDDQVIENDDRYLQWELPFDRYKQHFKQFDFDYLLKSVKTNEESVSSFTYKIRFLIDAYLKNETKTLFYFEAKRDSLLTKTNIMLHSLYILSNKYGIEGSGVISLHKEKPSATSSNYSGTFSTRLPAGNFTKYKQHRQKAESIWRIPEHTLNSIASSNPYDTLQKYCNNTTKFLWIMGANSDDLKLYQDYLTGIQNGFLVYSSSHYDDFTLEADLILPSTTFFEKSVAYENSFRQLALSNQQLVPYENSMSELWQILEFSKRFRLKDTYKELKIDTIYGTKNILNELEPFGYTPSNTLFEVLFLNKTAQKYKLSAENYFNPFYINSEVKGDMRKVFGGDGTLFSGYKIFIQRYLFEEMRLFGLGFGYDLATFAQYSSNFYGSWPIIFNSQTNHRFSIQNDQYAKRIATNSDQFIFYGNLGNKQLPTGNLEEITLKSSKELKNRAKIFTGKEKSR